MINMINQWNPSFFSICKNDFSVLQATLRGEVQGTEGILHDAGPCGHPRADAVAGIFHGQNVHLKAVPQLTAETVAAAKVLRVALTEWMG